MIRGMSLGSGKMIGITVFSKSIRSDGEFLSDVCCFLGAFCDLMRLMMEDLERRNGRPDV
jgi:hypothetical protein